MDTETYINALLSINPLRESLIWEAIETLQLPSGSDGLDAGCGIGLQCLQMAEAVGPAGHVTGMDITPDFLDRGRGIAQNAGLSDRISFKKGDATSLPFDDNAFDWVWSSDCVGYSPSEQIPLLREMARVVKPGGIVALAAWSSEKLLPGHPELEARLGTTSVGLAPYIPGNDPDTHFLRALSWFRKLRFENPKAEVFSKSIKTPANSQMRDSLIYLFESRWHEVEAELQPENRTKFERLCKPDSPDFILDDPDYYGFFTYSLFWGKVPQNDS